MSLLARGHHSNGPTDSGACTNSMNNAVTVATAYPSSWTSSPSTQSSPVHGVTSLTFIQNDHDGSADSNPYTNYPSMLTGPSPVPMHFLYGGSIGNGMYPNSPNISSPRTPSTPLGLFDLSMAGVSDIELTQLLRASSTQHAHNNPSSLPLSSNNNAPLQTSTPFNASTSPATANSKKRKSKRKIACIVCHQAKTSCNGQRPCDRCVRVNKTHLCIDRPSKIQRKEKNNNNDGGKRGRKKNTADKKMDSPTAMSASVLSSLMSSGAPNVIDRSNETAAASAPSEFIMVTDTSNADDTPAASIVNVNAVPLVLLTSNASTLSPPPASVPSLTPQSLSSAVNSPMSQSRSVSNTPSIKTEDQSDDNNSEGNMSDDLSDHSHMGDDGASSEGSNDTEQTIQSINNIPLNSEGSAMRIFSQILLARHRKPYVRNLLNRVDAQQTTTCLYLIAHLQEIMIPEHFKKFLSYIGYVEKKENNNNNNSITSSPSDANSQESQTSQASMAPPKHRRLRTVFIHPHNHYLPTITYPSRFHFNWSQSPTECMNDSGVMSTFASLIICKPNFEYQRGKRCCYCTCACSGHVNGTSHIHPNDQSSPLTSPSPTLSSMSHSPYTPDFPASTASSSASTTSSTSSSMTDDAPLLNSRSSTTASTSSVSSAQSADLSTYDLHLVVHANAAFERLFGYSQQEIRVMFLREGKRALFRLTKDESWGRAQRNDYSNASVGQTEFKHFVVCLNKVLSEFACLMVRRLNVDENGLFHAASYTFIPLPTYSPHAREEMSIVQQAIPKVQAVPSNWQ